MTLFPSHRIVPREATEENIERIAKAIWQDRYPEEVWERAPDMAREDYRGHARAAYDAMLATAKTTELEEAVEGVIGAAKPLAQRGDNVTCMDDKPENYSVSVRLDYLFAVRDAIARLSTLTKKEG